MHYIKVLYEKQRATPVQKREQLSERLEGGVLIVLTSQLHRASHDLLR